MIMKWYQLKRELQSINPEILALKNPNDNTDVIFEGAAVENALSHYELRYCNRRLIVVWNVFKSLFWNQYYKSYVALIAEIDPLTNYDYTETKIFTSDHGDITKTRDTDNTKNYVESTIDTDITKTYAAGAGANAPKTDTYALSYDTEPKHTGYTTQTGQTTETTKTNTNGNKTKTVDNLKITNTESHTAISKTIGDETINADTINTEKIEKHGTQNINKIDMMRRLIELNKISILNDYITHFIDKYTMYVGGDENDIEFVSD